MNSKRRKVRIESVSRINGEVYQQTIPGEYMFRNGEHVLAYTDLIGNAITDTGLVFTADKALLHRDGAIKSDMLFEPDNITSSGYTAFGIPTVFNVHTHSYQLKEDEDKKELSLEYSLYGQRSEDAIHCSLFLTITKE